MRNIIDEVTKLSGNKRPGKLWRGLFFRVTAELFNVIPVAITIFALYGLIEGTFTYHKLVWITGGMLLSFLGQYVFIRASDRDTFSAGYQTMADLRYELADHIRKLPMAFFSERHTGDLINVVTENVRSAEELFTHIISIIIGGFASAFIILCIISFIDWRVALIISIALIVAFLFMAMFQAWFIRLFNMHLSKIAQASSQLLEYVQGIKLIRSYAITGKKFERLDNTLRSLASISIRMEVVGSFVFMGFVLILEAGFLGILFFGYGLVVQGTITISAVLASLLLVYRFYSPITELTVFLAQASYMRRNVDRIKKIMIQAPIEEPLHAQKPDRFNISLDNVSFSYDEGHPVLTDISFKVEEGSMTAVVGPSGSGKSTLLNLIGRFHDVTKGQVSVGNISVKDQKVDDHLKNISTVFQDVYLFQDTVINNIRVGKPEASMEEIIRAAKAASAHDFIMALPNGYETSAGEGGVELSIGERQRISIARAMLKDAPILLLDEATASLDPINETVIQKALITLMKDRTVIVIAHHLNTIKQADQIVVLKNGKIIEIGTHKGLMEKQQFYAAMWKV